MLEPHSLEVVSETYLLLSSIFSSMACQVFNLLRNQEEESYRGSRHLELLGEPICNRGFITALGLGKERFARLQRAARDPEALDCPADARFTPKGQEGSEKEQIVFQFLEGLYRTAAETLPDCPSNHASNKRPRHYPFKKDDPTMNRAEIRHLPPGDIIDYVRLLRAEHPDKKFSVKLVSRVWGQHFADKLRIRGTTHHSKCSVCIRHRLIVKRVGVGPARAAQLAELQKHLRLQYADRCCYWSTRSRSRLESDSLESTTVISGILDSMDQAKHCWPRSEAMSSKDFNSWGRPKMSSTTLILHGYGVVGALSPPQVPTNSSRTVEVLSFGLTRCVQVGVDWRQVALHLQSDNCAKECKNQTVLRFLGQMVGSHRLRAGRLSCLMSGHSHEDVDGLFSTISTYLDHHKELWTMTAFRECLANFFSHQHVRPYGRRFRNVEILTGFRDWTLGIKLLGFDFCSIYHHGQCVES